MSDAKRGIRVAALMISLVGMACARDPLGQTQSVPDGAAGAPSDGGLLSDAAGAPPSTVLFQLVDDMEDHDPLGFGTSIGLASWIAGPASAQGQYTTPGQWGTSDLVSPRDASGRALHAQIAGPRDLDLRLDIHGPGFLQGGPASVDLSAYAGIVFWSRGPSQAGSLVVAITDETTALGNSYAEALTSPNPWFEHPTRLTSEWRRHILLFDAFRQPGHLDARLGGETVLSVHFLAGLDGAGVDLWIDDLALLCQGACPSPAFGLPVRRGGGLDDDSLPWFHGDSSPASTGCAAIATLSMAAPSDLLADPTEKLLLRVRIPAAPTAAVPLWAWTVQHLSTGAMLGVTPIDDRWTTVAVPIIEPDAYRVTAHTHHPAMEVCVAEIMTMAR